MQHFILTSTEYYFLTLISSQTYFTSQPQSGLVQVCHEDSLPHMRFSCGCSIRFRMIQLDLAPGITHFPLRCAPVLRCRETKTALFKAMDLLETVG